MNTKYIFPLINFAPPYKYKMSYRFPIEELENHLPKDKNTKLRTEHKHFKEGKLIKTVNSNLEFDGGKWIDQSGLYYVCDSNYNEIYDWNANNEIEYIESNAEITNDVYLNDILKFQPNQNYALYLSKQKKTFISDGQLKFGAERTIHQIKAFGKWVEGYPDGNVSYEKNTDQSLILINPYKADARVKIELINNKLIKKNYSIPSLCAHRISISSLLDNQKSWSGQVLISGKFRLVFFILKHNLKGSNITTIEHSENYRGEKTHYSLKETLNKIKIKLKSYNF
jgi:hypothetical protein